MPFAYLTFVTCRLARRRSAWHVRTRTRAAAELIFR